MSGAVRRPRMVRAVRHLGEAPPIAGHDWRIVGQDGGQTIPLPGGETLFVFSDSLLNAAGATGLGDRPHGPLPPSTRSRGHQLFLANCAARSSGHTLQEALASLRFYLDARGRPRQILLPDAEEHRHHIRFWPAHGLYLGEKVLLFYLGIETFNPESAWGFRNLGAGLALLDPETGECSRLRSPDRSWCFWPVDGDDLHFGVQVLQEDEIVYVYFSRSPDPLVTGAGIARVEIASCQDPGAYTYLAEDGSWSPLLEEATSLGTASKDFSVSFNAHLSAYLMTYADPFEKALYLRRAPRPWGPFSEPVRVGELRHRESSELLYLGLEHPRFSQDRGRTVMVTYCQPHFVQNSLLAITLGSAEKEARPAEPATRSRGYRIRAELEYGPDPAHRLDLYVPESGPRPFPGLVLIRGGSWREGTRDDPRMARIAEPLARRGFLVAAIDYRHVPHAVFPAQIDDAQLAVRWLRSNAAGLELDPDRIGALGGSAGGQLASFLGICDTWNPSMGLAEHSSRVQCVITVAGVADLRYPHYLEEMAEGELKEEVKKILPEYMGMPYEAAPERWWHASPLAHVSQSSPPFFILHGRRDEMVPFGQARRMADALENAGVEVHRAFVEDLGHDVDESSEVTRTVEEQMRRAADFLDRHLRLEAGSERTGT